jgi:hypothetical protein
MSMVKRLCPSLAVSQSGVMGGLLVLAVAVGVAGYYGPWIAHRDAALVLIGQDLGEFVKFLPEVRGGTVPMVRQLFYLPPFCACLILALLAAAPSGQPQGLPLLWRPWRALFLVAILPLSLALLPPVFTVPVLKSPEFRLQVIGVAVCWAMLPSSWLLGQIPARLQSAGLALLGLAGALPALWQLTVIWPAIGAIYHEPLHIGWGLVATVLGFLGVTALGLAGLNHE